MTPRSWDVYTTTVLQHYWCRRADLGIFLDVQRELDVLEDRADGKAVLDPGPDTEEPRLSDGEGGADERDLVDHSPVRLEDVAAGVAAAAGLWVLLNNLWNSFCSA